MKKATALCSRCGQVTPTARPNQGCTAPAGRGDRDDRPGANLPAVEILAPPALTSVVRVRRSCRTTVAPYLPWRSRLLRHAPPSAPLP
jgi:hypothetical protein